MDARHQSIEQDTLNQLINAINEFARENIDEMVANTKLREEIKLISHHIYNYANQPVEVDEILSNKNLLSIDAVMLPNVDEVIVSHQNFSAVVRVIRGIITAPTVRVANGLEESLLGILNNH